MIETKPSDLELLMKTMKLSDGEADNATRFIKKHRTCTMESRSFNNVKYTIAFSETSLGNSEKIEYEKCHSEKDISDDLRSNW